MATMFGVTSAISADKKLTNGYQLYDWVMRMNSFPAFWGRGILGKNAITEEEAAFLHEKNCKIALLVNDLTEAEVSTNDGTESGRRAVEAAKQLGTLEGQGIALFAAFGTEWSMHHNWMMSYAQTVVRNGFLPGFIGNTDSSMNFNFDRQCSHYVQATQDVEEYGAVYWATEPKADSEPEEWTPFSPSAVPLEKIGLWSLGTIKMNDILIDTVYARDASLLSCMW